MGTRADEGEEGGEAAGGAGGELGEPSRCELLLGDCGDDMGVNEGGNVRQTSFFTDNGASPNVQRWADKARWPFEQHQLEPSQCKQTKDHQCGRQRLIECLQR